MLKVQRAYSIILIIFYIIQLVWIGGQSYKYSCEVCNQVTKRLLRIISSYWENIIELEVSLIRYKPNLITLWEVL